MPKYINAHETKNELSHFFLCEKEEGESVTLKEIEQVIDRMESADVVEIIRCEKCKHLINNKGHLFNNCCLIHRDSHGFPMEKNPNDFCSRGEIDA